MSLHDKICNPEMKTRASGMLSPVTYHLIMTNILTKIDQENHNIISGCCFLIGPIWFCFQLKEKIVISEELRLTWSHRNQKLHLIPLSRKVGFHRALLCIAEPNKVTKRWLQEEQIKLIKSSSTYKERNQSL